MTEMLERAVQASHVAGEAYIATLPTRLDQRPIGWRRTLATVRATAAILRFLDPEDEALVFELAWGDYAESLAKEGKSEPERDEGTMHLAKRFHSHRAHAAIKTLRRMAQGEL